MKRAPSDLPNTIVYYVSSIVVMLDSWREDEELGGLCESDRLLVITKMLHKAGFAGKKEEIEVVKMGIIAINPKDDTSIIKDLRERTNFDVEVMEICERFDLPERLYRNTSRTGVREYAETATIFPAMEDGNYKAFIVKISDDNEQFASALNRDGGQEALQMFIQVIDERIKNRIFDDPLLIVEEMYGPDPHLRKNYDAERFVFSCDETSLFSWKVKK